MKKLKIVLIAFAFLLALTATAKAVNIGEWSNWWSVNWSTPGSVKRIYDHENKLVCWIFDGVRGGGISCYPSIELGHPSVK